jgi:lipopolysaccharide transport system ATP-binding protein
MLGTKQRRELWALRDVSFAVERGEILGIIGPNGAGKTTLLKVLSRVTPPTEGRVVGVGRVVPLLALGAGFQEDLSGRDNIFLNAAIYGVTAADVAARLDDIVEFADLGDFIDVPAKRYSSGMYLRLAFSVAINMRPDILLADEVLAVGDIDFQERCLERVKQAGRDGMSVLFVSHDMAAITRLCTRVLWLNAGEIVKIGDPDEVVSEYQNASWSMTGRRLKDSRSGSHKSAAGEVLFVMLTAADGREVGAVRAEDEVFIKVGLRVDLPDVTLRFVLHVSAHGTLAFRVRSEFFTVKDAGVHITTIRIPPDLLAETIYSASVDVIIVRSGTEKSSLSAFNALSFQVFDPSTARRDNLGGLISPKLQWTFTAQPQAAGTPSRA